MPLSSKQKRNILKALSPQDAPSIAVQELTEMVEEAIGRIPVPKDGPRGPVGDKGDKGDKGTDGKSIVGPKGDKGDPGKDGTDGKDAKEVDIKKLQREIVSRLPHYGGGQANRNISVGGNSSTLSRYTDINWKAGSNISLTYVNNDNLKTTDITVAVSGGSGVVRSIASTNVSSTVGAIASTDYVVIAGQGVTVTMPTAANNTNLYTIKNVSTSSVLVAPSGLETIDDSPNLTLATQYTSVDLISDNTNWKIT